MTFREIPEQAGSPNGYKLGQPWKPTGGSVCYAEPLDEGFWTDVASLADTSPAVRDASMALSALRHSVGSAGLLDRSNPEQREAVQNIITGLLQSEK